MWGLDVLGQLPRGQVGPRSPLGPQPVTGAWPSLRGQGTWRKDSGSKQVRGKALLGLLLKPASAVHLTFNWLRRSAR